ncbi:uncharacterized protein LACBIDRAFT_301283 [Laccaria bicolor S238N-H82]|uniref:Predicted protein n=1 Tax=Laccaria bicolor (strain S238N-H82 / ATCC MYA-4686) TaxID=486041 RepID=B0CRS6_LACBS|nr:uncharacterized protein LACBIDRAFT_301283 [Laccaria bicolor S238N-H82]EDR15250.1 predicted protein [Laccaria bicolor S238N-H82]|eukprot:XP_001873458.1 predicted protein [Laccaria bicolor S238N-H82]
MTITTTYLDITPPSPCVRSCKLSSLHLVLLTYGMIGFPLFFSMTVLWPWSLVDVRQLLAIEVAYKGSDSGRSDRILYIAV